MDEPPTSGNWIRETEDHPWFPLAGELGNSLGKKKTVHGDILRSRDAMRRIIGKKTGTTSSWTKATSSKAKNY